MKITCLARDRRSAEDPPTWYVMAAVAEDDSIPCGEFSEFKVVLQLALSALISPYLSPPGGITTAESY